MEEITWPKPSRNHTDSADSEDNLENKSLELFTLVFKQ